MISLLPLIASCIALLTFMISSGRCVPMPVIPMPAFAVPYAAPTAIGEEVKYASEPSDACCVTCLTTHSPGTIQCLSCLRMVDWMTRTAKDHLERHKWKEGSAYASMRVQQCQALLTDAATPAKPKNGAYAVMRRFRRQWRDPIVSISGASRSRRDSSAAYEDIVPLTWLRWISFTPTRAVLNGGNEYEYRLGLCTRSRVCAHRGNWSPAITSRDRHQAEQ